MSFILAVDNKLIRCDSYVVSGNILTLKTKTSVFKFEKKLYERALEFKDSLLDRIVANYCNTYKIDGKTFHNCFPIFISKSEIQLYFSDSIDIEKIKELIHD